MLPPWTRGTPAVLCAAGPHAIPVSTALRAGDRRVVLALGRRRETLRRLREDPRAALCVLGEGLAFTAYGRARVVRDTLECAPGVVAVAVEVERVQDHLADGRTEMLGGAGWRRLHEQDSATDRSILGELEQLAG